MSYMAATTRSLRVGVSRNLLLVNIFHCNAEGKRGIVLDTTSRWLERETKFPSTGDVALQGLQELHEITDLLVG